MSCPVSFIYPSISCSSCPSCPRPLVLKIDLFLPSSKGSKSAIRSWVLERTINNRKRTQTRTQACAIGRCIPGVIKNIYLIIWAFSWVHFLSSFNCFTIPNFFPYVLPYSLTILLPYIPFLALRSHFDSVKRRNGQYKQSLIIYNRRYKKREH